MASSLETIDIRSWRPTIAPALADRAVEALESGKVLYFPALSFPLEEGEFRFFAADKIDPKTKNISYDLGRDRLAGTLYVEDDARALKAMIKRYAFATRHFLETLIPNYATRLIQARTSFRPIEISGRKSSYRKDDTLLHVDSFPATPTKGQRILRLFTNINPEGKPRVWRLGEPFQNVVEKIAPKISPPLLGVARLLQLLRITKDYRTPYDHYMLQIHDTMKGDSSYQAAVAYEEVFFPAGSSWLVFTDQVSHAAMAGRGVLEQTFGVPIEALRDSSTSPLRVLESVFDKTLV